MADSEHNDFFDALDNAKEHAADMAAAMDEAPPNTKRGQHKCKHHGYAHYYVEHTLDNCGHEFCPYAWKACPRCHGAEENNRREEFDAWGNSPESPDYTGATENDFPKKRREPECNF